MHERIRGLLRLTAILPWLPARVAASANTNVGLNADDPASGVPAYVTFGLLGVSIGVDRRER